VLDIARYVKHYDEEREPETALQKTGMPADH
jgi:hypothetical protein